jgi:ABC-type multidrug transport system fused ATPase/permease subunit
LLTRNRAPLFARLLANAGLQAVLAFAVAWSTREALQGMRTGSVPWSDVAAIGVAGATIYLLKVLEAGDAEHFGQRYVASVRQRLLKRLTRVEDARTDVLGSFGLTMTRLTHDLNSLRNWIALGVARGGVAVVSVLGIGLTIGLFAPQLFAVYCTWVAGVLGVGFAVSRQLATRVRAARAQRGRLATLVGRLVLNARTARLLGRAGGDLKRIRKRSASLRHALGNRTRYAQALRLLPSASMPLAYAGLIAFGAHTPVESLVAVLLMFSLAATALAQLTRAMDYRVNFIEGRRRVQTLLGAPRVTEPARALTLPAEGALSLHIPAAIDPASGAQQNLSLEAGTTRVLPAATCDWLFPALVRLRNRTAAGILLSGQPLSRLSIEVVNRRVHWLSERVPLIDGNPHDNLLYADGSEADIEAALALCGLETNGNDNDVRQWRGTRQARLRLARALVMRPGLLLVDDPHLRQQPELAALLRHAIEEMRCTAIIAGSPDFQLITDRQTPNEPNHRRTADAHT